MPDELIKTEKIRIIAVVLFLLVFLQSCESGSQTAVAVKAEKEECVILLHGLARTGRSMAKLEKSLSDQGYRVHNVNYPSTEHSIEYLAEVTLDRVIKECRKTSQSKIHFVTHSIGGIIVRYYLSHHEVPNLGRVVMLSPPNQGSELVDYLGKNLLLEKFWGPAVRQLGTGKDGIPQSLGPVDFKLGVIAGNRSFNLLYSVLIPGPDDGIVSVKRAKVAGMSDFLVLPYSHTFIMRSQKVIDEVIYFLEHGKFRRGTSITETIVEAEEAR